MKAIMRALAIAWALLLCLVVQAAATPYTIQPGTTSVPVGNETFSVTTDQTIVVDLAFTSPDVLQGSVNVSSGQSATVKIVWSRPGLTVFTGSVVASTDFRFDVPKKYQATQDSGHTEK